MDTFSAMSLLGNKHIDLQTFLDKMGEGDLKEGMLKILEDENLMRTLANNLEVPQTKIYFSSKEVATWKRGDFFKIEIVATLGGNSIHDDSKLKLLGFGVYKDYPAFDTFEELTTYLDETSKLDSWKDKECFNIVFEYKTSVENQSFIFSFDQKTAKYFLESPRVVSSLVKS